MIVERVMIVERIVERVRLKNEIYDSTPCPGIVWKEKNREVHYDEKILCAVMGYKYTNTNTNRGQSYIFHLRIE